MCQNFSSFSTKTDVVGTHKKRLDEVLLMCTYNMFSSRNTKQYFLRYASYLELGNSR